MSFSPEETSAQLRNERSILVGLFLGTIGFGVHLTLFMQCVGALYRPKEGQRNRGLLAFISILFILGNIGNATNIKLPRGPNAFFVEQSTNWSAVVCNSVYIVNSWFQDALLLYRFWIIWACNYYVLVVPALAFLSSMVLSAILIAELSQPENTLWTTISVNLAIPYWSISISMTIILTALIAGRLLYMRYRTQKLGGIATGPTPHFTLTAMLVESAAVYSVDGLIFLISYGINSPVQNLALPLLGQTQSIAPLLIILRMAQGRGWTSTTGREDTTGRLARGPTNNGASTTALETSSTADSEPKKDRENVDQTCYGAITEMEFRANPDHSEV
ncbi:hypothetical protein C8R46DRAFT_1233825 [Mycena filopes]|nr:hypothetical protein C8R46DRAFT_1233825 [Mycena filopes]